MSDSRKKKVLILGGGFAGMYAALEFEKILAREPDLEVTMINRENFFLFTPMLHEVAASDLDATDIVNPARKLLKRVKFYACEVTRIDIENRQVEVCHGFDPHTHTLGYDHLVLALGSVTNFYGLPGLAERALCMKSLDDAMKLRNRLIQHLEEADSECSIRDQRQLLTFLVAGGGFAGVETIAGVNDFLREALPYYPSLRQDHLRVVLVHPGKFILPELGEDLGRYAEKKLTARGVQIRCNTKVVEVVPGGFKLTDGTEIMANTIIWTAGTTPNPMLEQCDCAKERGRIKVTGTMEVEACPGVWALGDSAAIPDPVDGGFYPPTAQHASREGKLAARNIMARIQGLSPKPFRFKTIGLLAAIGHRTGVAKVMGVKFSGFVAWWLWRTIYLSKLPTLQKKVRVALNWTLDLFFSKDFVQYLDPHSAAGPFDDVDLPSRDTCDKIN